MSGGAPKQVNLGPVIARPDMNENDPTSPSYVKNRICYTEGTKESVFISPTLLSNVTLDANGTTGDCYFEITELMETGLTYKIKVGDSEIDFQAVLETLEGTSLNCIGDSYTAAISNSSFAPTYGFSLVTSVAIGSLAYLLVTDLPKFMELFEVESEEAFVASELSVSYMKEVVHKMPAKYLPLRVVQVESQADALTIDFSQFDAGDIILLVTDATSALGISEG